MGSLAGCGGQQPGAKTGGARGGKSTPPVPVVAAQVQRKVVPLTIDAIGAIEPIRATSVRSQVTGTLVRIAIREGQDVKQGDLLFEIDPRPFRNALQSAEAELQKIRVQLGNARAQVDRYRTLSTDQMVSQEQFQRIQDEARALEAAASSAESAAATARLQLEHCSIRSPLDGSTGNIAVHEGDLIRASDAGTPLVRINQLHPIYVTFGVPQQHLADLMRYRAAGTIGVSVVPPGADDTAKLGTLTFVDNNVDSATGTLKLKGTVPNDDHRLWPGQFAKVVVTLASPEVLVVAASAIQNSQAGQYVFVVKPDRTAEQRPILIERTFRGDAVVSRGLEERETVVIDGQIRVVPGRPVDIKPPGDATGAPQGKAAAEPAPTKPNKAT